MESPLPIELLKRYAVDGREGFLEASVLPQRLVEIGHPVVPEALAQIPVDLPPERVDEEAAIVGE